MNVFARIAVLAATAGISFYAGMKYAESKKTPAKGGGEPPRKSAPIATPKGMADVVMPSSEPAVPVNDPEVTPSTTTTAEEPTVVSMEDYRDDREELTQRLERVVFLDEIEDITDPATRARLIREFDRAQSRTRGKTKRDRKAHNQ